MLNEQTKETKNNFKKWAQDNNLVPQKITPSLYIIKPPTLPYPFKFRIGLTLKIETLKIQNNLPYLHIEERNTAAWYILGPILHQFTKALEYLNKDLPTPKGITLDHYDMFRGRIYKIDNHTFQTDTKYFIPDTQEWKDLITIHTLGFWKKFGNWLLPYEADKHETKICEVKNHPVVITNYQIKILHDLHLNDPNCQIHIIVEDYHDNPYTSTTYKIVNNKFYRGGKEITIANAQEILDKLKI